MGLFSGIGRVFSSVARAVTGGLGSLLSGGLSGLMKPLSGILGGLTGKLNGVLGGLANKVAGFLGNFGPGSANAQGSLGMLGGLLGALSGQGGGLGKIADFATNLLTKFGGPQNVSNSGLNNLTELFAQSHANSLQGLLGSLLGGNNSTARN